ncbi:MAG TPA: 50S ribosomal protein L29 [Actinomycetota bacterium]|nr:50S ribosomal protein L29 [Actinomycetota bacterium]
MTRIQELRDLEDVDLLERLESNKEELFNLRFQLATGQLDNPMRIKQVRHDVARILTILRERDLAAELDNSVVEETAVEDLEVQEPQAEEES